MTDVSDEAIRKATGHGQDHWHRVLDEYQGGHAALVRSLQADHPELSGWWAQTVVVDYERVRGLREFGQSCTGDFQVSCSRTLPLDVKEAWERVVTTPFLGHSDWETGVEADVDGARIEVRRVDPGKMLRWFWFDGHKSTVEVQFIPKDGRCTVTFRHHGLPDKDAVERYRSRWKAALATL